jgi:hypothetical protein
VQSLTLSWPDPLAEWQLQQSSAPDAGWADVPTAPALANNVRSVAVPATNAAGFFRLRPDNSGPAAAALPATSGVKTAKVTAQTKTQLLKTTKPSHEIAF